MNNLTTAPEAKPLLVVIPCLNEERHIEKLLAALLRQGESLPLHIIVADGGSADRTPAIAREMAARHPSITYLHNPRRLQGAALNLAVAQYGAQADFLIRIDAHAGYPDIYCAALAEEQRVTGADAVVVAMDTVGTGCFQKAVAAAQNSKLGNGGAAHRNAAGQGAWVEHGHHALMRIAAFRAVGGYDESFSHNEDAELDLRLTGAGCKIWLTAKTGADYYPRSAPWPLCRQYYFFGAGRARTILKHCVKPRLRQLAPAAILPAVCLLILTPLTAWAAFPLFAWAILCLAYGFLLGFRKKEICISAAGFAAMIMHLAWSLGFWRAILATPREKLR